MKKKIVKYVVDLILIVLFIIVGITGVIIFPELLYSLGFHLNSYSKAQIYQIHHWIGLVLFIFAGIHIDSYWRWLEMIKIRYHLICNGMIQLEQRELLEVILSTE